MGAGAGEYAHAARGEATVVPGEAWHGGYGVAGFGKCEAGGYE